MLLGSKSISIKVNSYRPISLAVKPINTKVNSYRPISRAIASLVKANNTKKRPTVGQLFPRGFR